jgi:hypothetical protein
MSLQSFLHLGDVCGSVVVHNQVESQKLATLDPNGVETSRTPDGGGAPYSPMTLPSACSKQQIEWPFRCACNRGSKWRTVQLSWQTGLGSVQDLDLAFLIHANHQGLVGRVQIQAHNFGQLRDKLLVSRQFCLSPTVLLVSRQFKAAAMVGFQSVGIPDALDAGRTDSSGVVIEHLLHDPALHGLNLRRQLFFQKLFVVEVSRVAVARQQLISVLRPSHGAHAPCWLWASSRSTGSCGA